MKDIRRILNLSLFVGISLVLVPNQQIKAQSINTPLCRNYIYIPSILKVNDNTNQIQQLDNQVQTNHTFIKPDFNGDGCADLSIVFAKKL